MFGTNPLLPFFGVVEETNDPEKLDRYQVRCYGYHTENKAYIPTSYLQWMYPVGQGAGVSGIGSSKGGYVRGSTVFGFFVDKELQTGVIMGSMKGKPNKKIFSNMGFGDPEGIYPLYVNESDVNRIARNENIEKTIVGWKINNRVVGIPKIDGGSWEEPETEYNTKYPDNKVFETESGHVVEYDDTPGAERISINHRTGSFQEYRADGGRVDKVMGDSFSIFLGGSFVFINGDVNQFINGDVNQNISGDYVCRAKSITFDSDVKITGTSSATDHLSSEVSGKDHTHNQAPDSNGDVQQSTKKPENQGSGFNKTSPSSLSIQIDIFDPDIRKT